MTALRAIPGRPLCTYLDALRPSQRLQLVLTDGNALTGFVGSAWPTPMIANFIQRHGGDDLFRNREFEELGALTRQTLSSLAKDSPASDPFVRLPTHYGERVALTSAGTLILVPMERISGGMQLDFIQEEFSPLIDMLAGRGAVSDVGEEDLFSGSVHDVLTEITADVAAEEGFPTFDLHEGALDVRILPGLRRYRRWKPPPGYTVTYMDLDYWTSVAGGPTDFGLSSPFGGGNVGGNPALASDMYDKLARAPSDPSRMCDEASVTLEGTLASVRSVRIGTVEALRLDMQEHSWEAKYVVGLDTGSKLAAENPEWALVYFVERGKPVGIPYDQWAALEGSMRVFGEVVKFKEKGHIVADRGVATCYVKARGAGTFRNESHSTPDVWPPYGGLGM